jgi:hypothetical protein
VGVGVGAGEKGEETEGVREEEREWECGGRGGIEGLRGEGERERKGGRRERELLLGAQWGGGGGSG